MLSKHVNREENAYGVVDFESSLNPPSSYKKEAALSVESVV